MTSRAAIGKPHLIVAASLLLGLLSGVGQFAGFFGRVSIITALASIVIAVLIVLFFPQLLQKHGGGAQSGSLTTRRLCGALAASVVLLGAAPFVAKVAIAARAYKVGGDYLGLDQHAPARVHLARSARYYDDLGLKRSALQSKIALVQSAAALGDNTRAQEIIAEVTRSDALTTELQSSLDIVRGILAYHAGQYEQAARFYQAAHQTVRPGSREQATLLQNEAALWVQRGGSFLPRALENYRIARNIYDALGDKIGITHIMLNEATVFFDDAKEAIPRFESALRHAKELNNPLLMGTIELNLGRLRRRQSRFEEAQQHFDRARDGFEKAANVLAQAELAISESQLELARGRIEAARQKSNQAAALLANVNQIKEPPANVRKQGALAVQLAGIYDELGDSEQAERRYREAFSAYETAPDPAAEAAASADFAALLLRLNRGQEAQRELQRAREILRLEARPRNLAGVVHNNLGMAFQNLGDLTSARAEYTTAMGIFESLEYRLESAEVLENIAVVDMMAGRKDSVAERLERALAVYNELNHYDHQVGTLFNLFLVDAGAGSPRAQARLDRLLSILKGNQVSQDTEAAILFSLLPKDLGPANLVTFRERIKYLNRFYEERSESIGIGRSLLQLARIEQALGNVNEARSYAEEAATHVDAIPLPLRIHVHSELGWLLLRPNDVSGGLEHFWKAFDLLEGMEDELRLTLLEAIARQLPLVTGPQRDEQRRKLQAVAASGDPQIRSTATRLLASLN
ncbi:MAG TPA: tetratricopeptide repeat protein [Longimicrobiales bacterium]